MREFVIRVQVKDDYGTDAVHKSRLEAIIEGDAVADYDEYKVLKVEDAEEYDYGVVSANPGGV
jgi:hypothetical protein